MCFVVGWARCLCEQRRISCDLSTNLVEGEFSCGLTRGSVSERIHHHVKIDLLLRFYIKRSCQSDLPKCEPIVNFWSLVAGFFFLFFLSFYFLFLVFWPPLWTLFTGVRVAVSSGLGHRGVSGHSILCCTKRDQCHLRHSTCSTSVLTTDTRILSRQHPPLPVPRVIAKDGKFSVTPNALKMSKAERRKEEV